MTYASKGKSDMTEEDSPIVIVDDDEDVCDVLCGLLELAGHHVRTYKSGLQFLAEDDTSTTACLIVDQRMPGMTGLELLSELQRRGAVIPAVLVTGANNSRLAKEAFEHGALAVLRKPIAYQEFLKLVAFTTA
jgi:two-component system, LuxR family, response regulator FixJ